MTAVYSEVWISYEVIYHAGLELAQVLRVPGTCRNSEHHLWHPWILRFLLLTDTPRPELILCNKWHPQFQIPNASPEIYLFN